MRATFTSRDVRAGCFVCHGDEAHWYHPGAQGTAAQHHDATGHATWSDVILSVRYGEDAPDPRQIDLEDSIAASTIPPAGSGSRPDATPLPVPAKPAIAPAGAASRLPETTHV